MVTGVETPDRVEVDDIGSADTAQTISRGPLWWIHRLAPARLTSRIVLLNIAGLIVLVSGIRYFNQFRQGLIDARVQSLLPQAHIIAAAVAGAASIDTGSMVIDPAALINSPDGPATAPRQYDHPRPDHRSRRQPGRRQRLSLWPRRNPAARAAAYRLERDGL